jgi:hypothetical protein
MTSAYELMIGRKRVRRTYANTLSPEKNAARIEQMRFCKEVAKLLGDDYKVEFHFNAGGHAVWGETYVKVYSASTHKCSMITCNWNHDQWKTELLPIVEACLSVDFSYMRQWNGKQSGGNHFIKYNDKLCAPAFAMAVKELERREFRPF